MIIALSGRIGSGKDTVGKMIQYLGAECSNKNDVHYRTFEEFLKRGQGDNQFQQWYSSDWEIKKFAGKLKQIASLLTGIPVEKFEDQEFKKTYLGPEWQNIVYNPPAEPYNELMTVRLFLQKLGTEAIRDGLHTNAWVNALFADYTNEENWIITDCRFPNEAQAIKDRGGVVVKINRKDEETTARLHPSETALDNWEFDYVINNDGDLNQLMEKVNQMLQHFEINIHS